MKNKQIFPKVSLVIMLLFQALISAQVGIGTTSPDDGAIVDISSTDKGLLIPRITLTGLNDNTTITPITTGLLTVSYTHLTLPTKRIV